MSYLGNEPADTILTADQLATGIIEAKLGYTPANVVHSHVAASITDLSKNSVGLNNVDNTSDTNKPISTAAQTALDLKLDAANPTYTGHLIGGTGEVNLGSGQFIKDAAGNVGVGVTPSAWSSTWKVVQLGSVGTSIASNGVSTAVFRNAYNDGTGQKYISSSKRANAYWQTEGGHSWWISPVGNAGDPITFTVAMKIDTAGNLGLGVSSSLSPWGTQYKALDINSIGSLAVSSTTVGLTNNSYEDSLYNQVYKTTGVAT